MRVAYTCTSLNKTPGMGDPRNGGPPEWRAVSYSGNEYDVAYNTGPLAPANADPVIMILGEIFWRILDAPTKL